MLEFSIITCTFNSAEYLEKNITSIKNQNFVNFEHIFIDGFSNDNTLDIIRKYQLEFPGHIKVFQFKPMGISKAMNQGIKNSSGRYIIHLHSDDSFFDNRVLQDAERFIKLNRYPDWIYGKINVLEHGKTKGIFPNKKIWHKKRFNDFIRSYLLKFYNYIPHQAVFIKREVFDKFGIFDESLKYGMDPDLWLRIRTNTRWLFFNRVISNFSLRSDSQSSGFRNKEENKNYISLVRKKNLNRLEFFIANLVDLLLSLKYDNYQK